MNATVQLIYSCYVTRARMATLGSPNVEQHWIMLLKNLVNVYYPDALLITVVQDNLNTHSRLPCTKRLSLRRHGVFSTAYSFVTPKAW